MTTVASSRVSELSAQPTSVTQQLLEPAVATEFHRILPASTAFNPFGPTLPPEILQDSRCAVQNRQYQL